MDIQGWFIADLRSSSNTTLSGEQTIDGVLTSNSIVFLRNQTATAENGLWITSSGAWSRHPAYNSDANIRGSIILIAGGSTRQ